MIKVVKVEFEGQSKNVIAKTKVEYTFEKDETIIDTEVILKESKELFEKANNYAEAKTKQKLF